MTEQDLLRLVRAADQLESADPMRVADGGQRCLALTRARELALDPERMTEGERAHLESCRACRRLVDRLTEELPHPSLWLLLRWAMGWLLSEGDEARAMRYHLEDGRCRRCLARLAALEAVRERVVRLAGSFVLPSPYAMHGASATALDVKQTSPDQRLEARLTRDDGTVALEVRTKDDTVAAFPVAYTLLGEGDQRAVSGYTVLRPDVNGWHAANVVFDLKDLYDRLGGRCTGLLVCPLDLGMVPEPDCADLLAAAEREAGAPDAKDAWLRVAKRALEHDAGLTPDVRQRLTELRSRLDT
jgi:hypothetical protein